MSLLVKCGRIFQKHMVDGSDKRSYMGYVTQALKYIDEHRKELQKKYKNFDEFNLGFEVPESLVNGIVEKAAADSIKPKDDAELALTMPYLKTQLKALIARDLWDMNEYFHVFNETNDIVKKGIELLQQ